MVGFKKFILSKCAWLCLLFDQQTMTCVNNTTGGRDATPGMVRLVGHGGGGGHGGGHGGHFLVAARTGWKAAGLERELMLGVLRCSEKETCSESAR